MHQRDPGWKSERPAKIGRIVTYGPKYNSAEDIFLEKGWKKCEKVRFYISHPVNTGIHLTLYCIFSIWPQKYFWNNTFSSYCDVWQNKSSQRHFVTHPLGSDKTWSMPSSIPFCVVPWGFGVGLSWGSMGFRGGRTCGWDAVASYGLVYLIPCFNYGKT